MAKKMGLGRGLSAILQGDGDSVGFQHEANAMPGISELPIDQITPNP
jgi:hypothetical protein